MKKTNVKTTQTARELLIDAIYDLSGDEIIHDEDHKELAKADAIQLIRNLISIAEYYKNECESN
jgi:hypothetical protein